MAQNEISNSNALVTGATGFIGSNLVRALCRRGYSVTCLVRETSDTRSLKTLPVRLAVGSIENRESLRKAVKGIQTVFHIAGLTKAPDREQFLHVNRTGTSTLLEILAEENPRLVRFIHASSLAAAGPSTPDRPLLETDRPHPISWYGESKLQSEREVLKFADVFPVTILRPSAVYGPGDKDILLIFRMIQKGCLFTPGRFTRRFSLIHVHDLVDAFIKAGESDTPSGEVFFISRPEIYTWEDVGHAIASELGKKYRRVSFPQWLAVSAGIAGDIWTRVSGRTATINLQKVRELLQPSWLCNPSKARSVLGFSPTVELEDGVKRTVEWYRRHRWI